VNAAASLRRQAFRTTVRLRSPFLFASLDSGAVGVDVQTLTDEDGRAIIPADHLKGLLRHAMAVLAQHAPKALAGIKIEELFGAKSDAEANEGQRAVGGEAYAPRAGRLLFSDLSADEYRMKDGGRAGLLADWRKRTATERALTRIEIDDDSETVADGMLLVVDLPAPLGSLVDFSGDIVLYAEDAEARRVGAALNKALRLIPFFGAMRSVGFGEAIADRSSVGTSLPSQNIGPQALRQPQASPAPASGPPEWLTFVCEAKFDRPFIVDTDRLGDNILKGATIVPGAVVKGAIAGALRRAGLDPRQAGPLRAALENLRVSHGFPVRPQNGALCDRALPLAIKAIRGDGKDIMFAVNHTGRDDGLIGNRCADFQSDWKGEHFAALRERLHRPGADIALLPRGHTGINRATGAAEEGLLFVEAARSTRWRDSAAAYTFRFKFDFGDGAQLDSQEATAIFSALMGGLDGVGKTHARLSFDKPREVAPAAPAPVGSRFTLMLETSAALVDLDSAAAPTGGDGRPLSAFDQLRLYFGEALPQAKLIDAYLSMRRVGGFPAQRRRRDRGGGVEAYSPYVMFQPGCCFVFEAAPGADLIAALTPLLRTGLPAMRWRSGSSGAGRTLEKIQDWEAFPWLATGGYGEISLIDTELDALEEEPNDDG
jgi:hypothetical protein